MTNDYSYETAGKGIKEELEESLHEAGETLEEGRERASSWVEEQIALARERTREEPIKALAIAAGIGAILGAIFLR